MCVLTATTEKKQPGNMVLHLRFQRNYFFCLRYSCSFNRCAHCECYVVCLCAFVLVLPGKPITKVFLSLFFWTYFFYVSFFFSTHSLCISVRLKQNLASWKKETERNDESNRSHGQWNIYGVGISVCLHANRDYWSWQIVSFSFISFSLSYFTR